MEDCCSVSPTTARASHDPSAADWWISILSGSLAAIVGGLIGAGALYLVFIKTRAAEDKRDRNRSEAAAADAAQKRRLEAIGEFVVTIQGLRHQNANGRMVYPVPDRSFIQGVANTVSLLSVRMLVDAPALSWWARAQAAAIRSSAEDQIDPTLFFVTVDDLVANVLDWGSDEEQRVDLRPLFLDVIGDEDAESSQS